VPTLVDTHTGSDVFRAGGDEVDEACAAVELGEEDGGVALRVGAADPLQARPDGAVVAAPLAKHAAPVATHPHPESFNTIWCSLRRDKDPHDLTESLVLGQWSERGRRRADTGMVWCTGVRVKRDGGGGVYKASGGGATSASRGGRRVDRWTHRTAKASGFPESGKLVSRVGQWPAKIPNCPLSNQDGDWLGLCDFNSNHWTTTGHRTEA